MQMITPLDYAYLGIDFRLPTLLKGPRISQVHTMPENPHSEVLLINYRLFPSPRVPTSKIERGAGPRKGVFSMQAEGEQLVETTGIATSYAVEFTTHTAIK